MIIDTSAVIAILEDESERNAFEKLVAASSCTLSTVTYLEASIVLLHRRGEAALEALDSWIENAGVAVEPFTVAHARKAQKAYARFGQGRQRASLNFGDCATYALASERDEELLFLGDDFVHTDLRLVQNSSNTPRS